MDGSSSRLDKIRPEADEQGEEDDDEDEDAAAVQTSKKRKMVQKTVVTVKVEANKYGGGKQKSEGPPPSDSWSWRKYGQKPIKGTPFPRGYYRCSTSKGCSAKKQVERCKTDTSLIIITYTSSHNHPSPDLFSSSSSSPVSITNPSQQPPEPEHEHDHDHDHEHEQEQTNKSKTGSEEEELELLPKKVNQDQETEEEEDHIFHYYSQSCFNNLMITHQREEDPFGESLLSNHQVLFDGGEQPPLSLEPSSELLLPMEEKNDGSFFDELEELPMFPSSFSRLMTFVQ